MMLLAAAPFAMMAALAGQVPRYGSNQPPPPQGQRIEAKDGDTIVIRGNARIRTVHRSEAIIRAIYDSSERWLVLLLDYNDPEKGAPDGNVDGSYRFDDVQGTWPLGERWEGSAVIDDYSLAQGGTVGTGITVNGALVQIFGGVNNDWFADPRATAVLSYRGSGRSNSPGGQRGGTRTFDQAQVQAIEEAHRNAAQRGTGRSTTTFEGPSGASISSRVEMTVGGANAPVRVGGNIPQPKKIVDVRGVLPPVAAQAGVRGVVILEITIDTDGSVKDAKVLRSIPLLDQAAIDAAKQWRYEVTQLNGQPVPVILTATVAFQ